jgi:hypothetical protein
MAARKKSKRTSALKRRVKVPSAEKIFMVKRTFPGVTYGNIPLERGRLIRMLGLANDQKMLRLEYIEELLNPDGVTPSECGVCGAEFVGMMERDGHFKRSHKDVLAARERTIHDLTERERNRLLKKSGTFGPEDVGFRPQSTPDDIETEQIIQRENEISPLRLDKTAASRK